MAAHTVARAKHFTLTGTPTVDSVTFTGEPQEVELLNRGTTDPVYFVAASGDPADPTVEGDDADVVLAGGAVTVPLAAIGATRVELIAASAVAVSVRAID